MAELVQSRRRGGYDDTWHAVSLYKEIIHGDVLATNYKASHNEALLKDADTDVTRLCLGQNGLLKEILLLRIYNNGHFDHNYVVVYNQLSNGSIIQCFFFTVIFNLNAI